MMVVSQPGSEERDRDHSPRGIERSRPGATPAVKAARLQPVHPTAAGQTRSTFSVSASCFSLPQ